MEIHDTKMTGREAMELFARTEFEEPRKLGRILNDTGGRITRFKLVGGTQLYALEIIPTGWRITAEIAR